MQAGGASSFWEKSSATITSASVTSSFACSTYGNGPLPSPSGGGTPSGTTRILFPSRPSSVLKCSLDRWLNVLTKVTTTSMECSRLAKWSSGMLCPLAGYGSTTACSFRFLHGSSFGCCCSSPSAIVTVSRITCGSSPRNEIQQSQPLQKRYKFETKFHRTVSCRDWLTTGQQLTPDCMQRISWWRSHQPSAPTLLQK